MSEHEPTNHEPTNNESDTEFELRDCAGSTLRTVRDPDTNLDVFKAGLVKLVTAGGASMTVRAAVTESDDANATRVMHAMAQVVRDIPAVESAHVEPISPLSSGGATGTDAFDTVIAVTSARDGVGESTVSIGLACAPTDKHSAGLFNASIYGSNIPSLLDIEDSVYSDNEGHLFPASVAGPDTSLGMVNVRLMESGVPLARRGAMAHDALTELSTDIAWSANDTLVLDPPPGTGDVILTTLQETSVDGVVVVTTPFESNLENMARSIKLFRDNEAPILRTVVNIREFVCPSCGDTHRLLPGEVASKRLSATVLAELPFSPQFQGTSIPGNATPAFETLAESVSEAVAIAWDIDAPGGAFNIRGDPPEQREERVIERSIALVSGEMFIFTNDRDPMPVQRFLGGLTDRAPVEIDGFSVERQAPNDWLLTATKP